MRCIVSIIAAIPSGKRRTNIVWKDQVSSIDHRNAPRILLIGGPTASGKSRLALEIANQVPGEIINCDSRQIYKNLTIGTSQPNQDQLQKVPHHLYGFLPPEQSFTAADFERLVSSLILKIVARKRLPVLVGGTGFYMKALLRGVWPVSPKNDNLRVKLRRIEKRHHNRFLHNMLMRLDPSAAASIAPPDTYRLIRALEIFFQTGVRRSELQKNQQERYSSLRYFIDLPRDQLYEEIQKRTELMFEEGWVEEVKRLLVVYTDFEKLPASKSLGYREIIRYLRGEISLDDAKSAILLKTRQYAKRQVTWFRNQDQFVPITSETPLQKTIDCVLQWYQS